MKVIWTELALQHVGELWQFVAAENLRLADDLIDRIVVAVDRLENYPHSGRTGRIPDTRELVVPGTPFLVAYRVGTAIQVLAVLHGARQWPDAF